MNNEINYQLKPIGFVRSPLTERKNAPRQGTEGAPEAWLELLPEFADALLGMEVGANIWVLTWLHQGRRDTLQVFPRDRSNVLTGVFFTRSPDRPNPVGMHKTTVVELDGIRMKVANIEVSTARRSSTSSRCSKASSQSSVPPAFTTRVL